MAKLKESTQPTKRAASYKVELKVNNQVFKANGTSMFEAVNKLNPESVMDFFKTKGFFTAKKGARTYEHIFQPHQLRRLYNKIGNLNARKFWAAKIDELLTR